MCKMSKYRETDRCRKFQNVEMSIIVTNLKNENLKILKNKFLKF